jgi:hypothetical protein
MAFLQNDGWAALQSGERLPAVPNFIAELYYLDVPVRGSPKVRRLTSEGFFVPSSLPEWVAIPFCAALTIEQPPALVVPIYDIAMSKNHREEGGHNLKLFSRPPERCFVARVNQTYLRNVRFPQLIQKASAKRWRENMISR